MIFARSKTMKTLESFDFGRATSSKYDWDAILNGEINVMEVGKDFEGKVAALRARVRAVAKKSGLSVKTALTKNGDLVVQSYEKDADFEAAKSGEGKDESAPKRKRRAS